MADKPRTYPQQIQDLKSELEQKDAMIRTLQKEIESIPDLTATIEDLQNRLAAGIKADNRTAVVTKAQLTDLEQRATSAEQGLRNLQVSNKTLAQENLTLSQQLNKLATIKDESLGKDAKIEQLSQALTAAKIEVTKRNSRERELVSEAENRALQLERQLGHEMQARKAELDRFNQYIADLENKHTAKLAEAEKATEYWKAAADKLGTDLNRLKQAIRDIGDPLIGLRKMVP